MAFLHLLPLLLLLSTVSAYRFYGGTLNVNPKGRNPDGTFQVELRNKLGARSCHDNPYRCRSGDCGTVTRTSSIRIVWDSYRLPWCQREITTSLRLNSNKHFQIQYPTVVRYHPNSWYAHGYWAYNVISRNRQWRMLAHVDLGQRSDTGESNRPPVSTMLPIIRVTRNCPRTFSLTVFDPEDDRVKCRVARNRQECAFCRLPDGFSLDENSCTLTYGFAGQTGNHPIELVLEDYARRGITLRYSDGSRTGRPQLPLVRRRRQAGSMTASPVPRTAGAALSAAAVAAGISTRAIRPLSQLPLQFTVIVDAVDAPSCLDGEYFPIFMSPTPANGVNLPAFVGQTLEFTVKTKAVYSSIYRLLLTGPSGISQRRVSVGTYVVRWTPTENELDGHFPICFISEGLHSSQPYHSELRCLTVDVGHHDTVVTCSQTAIKVEVEKSYLIRRNENMLHLNDVLDRSCSLQRLSNSTHLVAVMSLNSCGTKIEEDTDNIIFRNSITSADTSGVISRRHDVDIAISCIYPKRNNVTLGFTHKNPYAFQERGFGAFTFHFEFFQSQLFRQQVDASTYPVEVYLRQMIYMRIEATSSIPNTELFVESCRATPYDNPDSRVSYSIIENGCVKDQTVEVYQSSSSEFRFGMQTFEFIGAHDQVYITCSVLLCESGVPGTRCSQGCIPEGHARAKREAPGQTSSHFISQGPLRLVKTDSEAPGLRLNLGVNLLFIVGCLLACAVVIYRFRSSRAKYQPIPTSETDCGH